MQSPLLEVLRGFGPHGPRPAGGGGQVLGVEQIRYAHGVGAEEAGCGNRVGVIEGERSLLEVPVVEEGIAAAQVDELAGPHCNGCGHLPLECRACFLAGVHASCWTLVPLHRLPPT